jgi:uncharacterized protein (DUF952 family)
MTMIVVKITDRDMWAAACCRGFFHGSKDDQRDGYIHLSTPEQLEGTAAKYFRGRHNLILVAFDPVVLGDNLRWEPSRDGSLFPHYYGSLPTVLAVWSRTLELDAEGIPRALEDDV